MKHVKLFVPSVLLGSLVFSGCAHRPIKAVNMVSLTPLPMPVSQLSQGASAVQSSYSSEQAVGEVVDAGAYQTDGVSVSSSGSGPGGRLAPATERVLYFGSSADGAVLHGPSREYVKLRESQYVEPAPVMAADSSSTASGMVSVNERVTGNVDTLGSGAQVPQRKPASGVMGTLGTAASTVDSSSLVPVPIPNKSFAPPTDSSVLDHETWMRLAGYSSQVSETGQVPAQVPSRVSDSLDGSMQFGVGREVFQSGGQDSPNDYMMSVSRVSSMRSVDPIPDSQVPPTQSDKIVKGVYLERVLSGASSPVGGYFYPLGISESGLAGMYRAQDLVAGSGAPQGGSFLYEPSMGGWGYFLPN
jgi:hypothetical protein